MKVLVAQKYLTLCDSTDQSLPGSSVACQVPWDFQGKNTRVGREDLPYPAIELG